MSLREYSEFACLLVNNSINIEANYDRVGMNLLNN